MARKKIPISNLVMKESRSTDVLHFTGGLMAMPVRSAEFVLGPVSAADQIAYVGPMSLQDVHNTAAQAGCYYVGFREIHLSEDPERSEFWYPNTGTTDSSERSSDSWAAVAAQAHDARDRDYRDITKSLSIALRSAGWRLRDVSSLHNEQLRWSVVRKRRSGERFSNIAVHDLYLAIHSLLAEMCSARDYLAQVAARRVSAKAGTDSWARLQDWLKKGANASAKEDPLVKLMIAATGTAGSPGWLAQLTEMRNQIMHRQPLAANPGTAILLLRIVATQNGLLPTIRLSGRSKREEVVEGEDPFITLLRFWLLLETLSRDCLQFASYPAEHPVFVAED